jgi:hypothetical protein
MAEARFIKTVAFGGYEKSEVIRRLEYLNSQVFDLKNELRETKLLLDAYRKGTDAEKANEQVLSGERAKLTQVQVQNETLSTKLKAAEEDNRNAEQNIKSMSADIEDLNAQLKAAKERIAALEAGNDATAISQVFIEAQKSADMIKNTAKLDADKMTADAKKAAEIAITDANDEAAQIIFEAQREAAVLIADAKNKTEEMNVSSNNMKSIMLDDVTRLGAEMTHLRQLIEKFTETGLSDITDAEERLFQVSNTLREGGVPVFRSPESYDPEIPDAPKRAALKELMDMAAESEDKQKKQSELEKLKQMAQSIGAKKPEEAAENPEEKAEEKPAEVSSEEPKEKKGGKIDLAALAAQASALGGKK